MLAHVDKAEALSWVLEKLSAARKAPTTPKPPAYIASPKRVTAEKKAKEVELYEKWKKGGQQPQDLDPLLASLMPLVRSELNKYRRAEVPSAATEMELKKEIVKGLKAYDPSKGMALQSFLFQRMQKTSRYVNANKTFTYSPENVTSKIGPYNAFRAEQTEKLGYTPDDKTLHDLALKEKHPILGKLSLKDIQRLNRDQRKGLIQQGFEDDVLLNKSDPRHVEVIELIKYQLTPDEVKVWELTFGMNGKPQKKPGEIAKALKMDNSKVSKLRSSIFKKMEPYLNS